MTEHEIVHVAVGPSYAVEESLLKEVAILIGKDPYDTRLLLAGGMPRIIAHYPSMQTAESIARRLRELGLVAFACEDSKIRKPSQSFRARTLEFGEGEVVFRDMGDRAMRMGPGDVFLILQGKMQTHKVAEVASTRMKFSLAATALMGGIPIWRRVKEKNKDQSVQAECFARLYGRKQSEPGVEILQNQIDYSFLETKMAPSALVNFNTVLNKLKEVFPQAIFDDTLVKSLGADARSTRARDSLEINCALIYLYHLAASSPVDDE